MTRPVAPVVIVAQASLPAIWLWIFLKRLLMAGRDAHPTIVNISPYLKTLAPIIDDQYFP